MKSLLPKIPDLNRLADMRDGYASERLDPTKGEKEREVAQREWQRLNNEIEVLWRDFQAAEPAVWAFAARLKQTLASIPLEQPLVALRSEIENWVFRPACFRVQGRYGRRVRRIWKSSVSGWQRSLSLLGNLHLNRPWSRLNGRGTRPR